jgi:hypothetical protein
MQFETASAAPLSAPVKSDHVPGPPSRALLEPIG